MLDGSNVECVAVVVKADAVIADAQAELRRLDVLETFHITLTCRGEVGQGMENTECRALFDSAELGLRMVPPDDFPAVDTHRAEWRD
jgi:hypothetical protein